MLQTHHTEKEAIFPASVQIFNEHQTTERDNQDNQEALLFLAKKIFLLSRNYKGIIQYFGK